MSFRSLTSELGQLFAIGVKLTGIVYFGFLIYAIVEQIYDAIIVVTILIITLYFAYLRRLLFSKRIEYSMKRIKINGEEFNFKEIAELNKYYLTLKSNPSKRIYFNHYFSNNRLSELKNALGIE